MFLMSHIFYGKKQKFSKTFNKWHFSNSTPKKIMIIYKWDNFISMEYMMVLEHIISSKFFFFLYFTPRYINLFYSNGK